MLMTMLVLVARARQRPVKTLKQWRKWFWIIVETLLESLLMMLAYRSPHSKQFLRMFLAWNVQQRRKLLSFEQKQRRINIAQEMFTTFNDDPDLLKKVIIGDTSWAYGYGIETKAQLSQWKRPEEPSPKKARQVWWNVKHLLTVSFHCKGVVHHEFLPQGHTVNKDPWSYAPIAWSNSSETHRIVEKPIMEFAP